MASTRKHVVYLCVLISVVACGVISVQSANLFDNNPYRHFMTLDPEGKYQLEWQVDWRSRRVIFNVTVSTNGWVGLGLARWREVDRIVEADMIMGGVNYGGGHYFNDKYALGFGHPTVDPSQDWDLHEIWEKGAQTFLSFSRPFDTCDNERDVPISDNLTTLIWAYGETDNVTQYHYQNRGIFQVYLLDPDLNPHGIYEDYRKGHPDQVGNMKVAKLNTDVKLPTDDTMYWCTFHRMPTATKHHIIGFNPVFPTDRDRSIIQAMTLRRCVLPHGSGDPGQVFEGPLRSGGGQCFLPLQSSYLPTQYCEEAVYSWAVGGRAIFFPEHVGLPVSEYGGEYFMLQIHYDNPTRADNLQVRATLEAFYTNVLRDHDIGMLELGERPGSTSIVIPPNSPNYMITSHCPGGCTGRMISKYGIHAFAVFLHTRATGRSVRLMNVRGDKELQWISNDDTFQPAYQQFRILRDERKIFPGDHLMVGCTYDVTGQNRSAVVGGPSARDEVCAAYVYYYSRSPGYSRCQSSIINEDFWDLLGIRNTTWDPVRKEIVVTHPPQFAGLSLRQYTTENVDWTSHRRATIQRYHNALPQLIQCPRVMHLHKIQRSDDPLPEVVQRATIKTRRRVSASPELNKHHEESQAPPAAAEAPAGIPGRTLPVYGDEYEPGQVAMTPWSVPKFMKNNPCDPNNAFKKRSGGKSQGRIRQLPIN